MINENDEDIEIQRQKDDEEASTSSTQDDLMYTTDQVPPWFISLALAIQQMFLCIGVLVATPAIVMPLLCADDSPSIHEHHTSLIGTCVFVAGLSTFLQTTFGVRLPLFQGTAGAFVVALIAIMGAEEWKCPPPLDVEVNSSDENLLVTIGKNNSSDVLFDTVTNTTIEIDPGSNYYRDNDGVIRNSNEIWMIRLNMIQGGVIMGSIVQILIGVTGIIGFLMRYIGPLTIAPTLTMVTYGTVDIAVRMSSKNWSVSLITIAAFYITSICMNRVLLPLPKVNIRKKKLRVSLSRQPIFSMFAVVFTLMIGWFASYVIETLSGGAENHSYDEGKVVSSSPWFRVPYPFQFGWPVITASGTIGILVAILSGILESVGDYNATAAVCREKPPPKHAINRGVVMEGVGVLISGLLGTGNATTSWSSNIVIIDASKVASRRVFQYCGILTALLGIFTKTLSVFSLLPEAVVGGMLCVTSGVIMSIGVSSLKRVDMKNSRNLFVFGFAVLFGMVISKFANQNSSSIDVGIADVNNIILVMMRNPMWVAGLTGFLLDNISPGSRKMRGLQILEESQDETSDNSNTYKPLFWADCKWSKWIPVCPNIQKVREQTPL